MNQLLNRLLLFLTGATTFTVINYSFDFVLYPFALYKLGVVVGFFTMMLLSFLFCWGYFIIYDYLKRDFLGIEFSKEKMSSIIASEDSVGLKLLLVRVLRKSRALLFVFLSIYFDPFVAVAFERKGNFAYNGLSARDWRLFILSLIISNGFWSTTVFAGLSFFEFLYKILLSWWNG
ncbi:MAG: hypothetical protein ACOVSR_02800 [Bacteroidia bacterium]|jgi:hypothetical protein